MPRRFFIAKCVAVFSGQDALRAAAYQAAGLVVDRVGMVRTASTQRDRPVTDVKPADHVLLLTNNGPPLVPVSRVVTTRRNDLPFAICLF